MKIILTTFLLLLVSTNCFSRDSSGTPLLADGFIEVKTRNDHYKTVNGVSTFCAWGNRKGVIGCKWLKAEAFLKFKLSRDDIEYKGMSFAPYSDTLVLYFAEKIQG